jgi:hypothetical protein
MELLIQQITAPLPLGVQVYIHPSLILYYS